MTCTERGCTWSTWTWVSVLNLLRHVTKPLMCSVTHSSLKPHAAGIHNKVQYITLSSIRNSNKDRMWYYCKLDLKQFLLSFILWHGFAGFSLSNWRSSNGVPAGTSMTGWPELLLFEELDIAQYVYSTQCVRGTGLYTSSSVSGVNIGFNTDAASYSQSKINLKP